MTSEAVLVDALPYFDSGYDEPGVKQAALQLVEEECKRYRPNKNYLEVFGPVNLHEFESEVLKNEFDRMEKRIPVDLLNMKRYELPPPPPGKQTDAAAWLECVENSCAQLEHQASRIINLEIMADYGSNSWRVYNNTLKTMQSEAEKQLDRIKQRMQQINLSRKNEQTMAGTKIRALEQSWVGLVSKNYEIECAIVELEKELLELKSKKQKVSHDATEDNGAITAVVVAQEEEEEGMTQSDLAADTSESVTNVGESSQAPMDTQ